MAEMIRDPDVLARYERDVSVVRGRPDAVVRPSGVEDVQRAIEACAAERTPVLAVGARTSTTGASVPVGGGVVVDLTAMGAQAEIDPQARTLTAQPGAVLADLHLLARQHGFDMPVDPTSSPDCTIGGAVATNASGPSSFRHGNMADWVVGLEFVDGVGGRRRLSTPQVPKRAMGPAAFQDAPRMFVGSEGTFGILTEVTLRLRQAPKGMIGAVVGFGSRTGLLGAVRALRDLRFELPELRAIEWLDAACCALIAPHAGALAVPKGQGGCLIVEVEEIGARSSEEALERVVEVLGEAGGDLESAQLVLDRRQQEALDHLRHMVPDTLNRQGRAFADAAGGGKLSTDWSAPLHSLPALLDWTDEFFADAGLDGLYMYGHIGDGHPHLNLLCPDAEVRSEAFRRLHVQLERVVTAGGVPVSEHGVGKLKRDLIRDFLPPGAIDAWAGLKAALDPKGILAPGNVFSAHKRSAS